MSAPEGLRVYRALLHLFPAGFRAERGPEMERMFRDMSAQWVAENGRLGLGFWASLAWDTAREAGGEWLGLFGETIRAVRDQTMGEHMSALMGDVRFGMRQLVRQPLFAGMVVLLMAIGIAGNTAVFRVVNGLFLKPLPFDQAERLVDLDETAPAWDLEYLSIAYRDYLSWQEGNNTFESMAVYDFGGGNFVGDGSATRSSYVAATHTLDDVLGLEPLMGRFFGAEEDTPDGPRAALLSQGFWEQEYGADPDVLGRTFSLNGYEIEIIGVLPPEARFFGNVDFWIPLRHDPTGWQGWGLRGMGRLAPGTTIEQARADLTAVHKAQIEYHEVNEISSPVVSWLRDRYLGSYRASSGFMLAAVGVVLLIACANIAGLMFVRSLARGPEIAVRQAMGAPRLRIVRQLLTESFVLAALGAAAGAGLGYWGSEALVAAMAGQFPSFVTFELDLLFLAFTLAVTGGAALVFGLLPALQASAANRPSGSAGRTTASRGRRRWMGLLVAGEVALALTLLVIGGLAMLDVRRLGTADPGFATEGLVSYRMALPSLRYADSEARLAFVDEYLARLEAIPGVESVGLTSAMPVSGSHWGWFFIEETAGPRAEDETNPVVLNRIVSPGYFDALGVRFAAGRAFDAFDGREEGNQAIIVNETFVRTHLSHLPDPIGARVTAGTDEPGPDDTWMTVVGVTRDVKHYGVDQEMRPGVYQPVQQFPVSGFQIALRVRGDETPVISTVRTLTAEMDAELPVFGVTTMREQLDNALSTRRATSWVIGAFSTVALLLAIAGLYGVISYSVSQRAQEISIRMAMGAEGGDVSRVVVRQGMGLVATGLVVGLVAAVSLSGAISGILSGQAGVTATEPWVYVGVTALLFGVAALANWLPARRAAALDPMRALRGE